MRLEINRDEAPFFRKKLQEELDAGSAVITISLRMSDNDARSLLAKTKDIDGAIECVWAGGFE